MKTALERPRSLCKAGVCSKTRPLSDFLLLKVWMTEEENRSGTGGWNWKEKQRRTLNAGSEV